MPFIASSRSAPADLICIILPKFTAPFANRFIGDPDATGDHHLLNIAVAEGKAEEEQDGIRDNFWGKAMVFVALRVGGRRHEVVPEAVRWLIRVSMTGSLCHQRAGLTIS